MRRRLLAAAMLACLSFPVAAKAACGDAVTPACLVEEVRALQEGLDPQDPFASERVRASLAQALFAAGEEEEALRTMESVENSGQRVNVMVAKARAELHEGRRDEAVETLLEADRLVMRDEPEARGRLNVTGQSHTLALELGKAGAAEEGRAILREIAALGEAIPPNPLVFALMLQVAEANADLGFPDEAALLARKAFGWFDEGLLEVEPSSISQLFEVWARYDAGEDPAREAAELVDYFAQEGPTAFNAAIWVGLAQGLQARGEDAGEPIARTIEALETAPERGAALTVEAPLAGVLASAGRRDEAVQRLVAAAKEAETLQPMERAPVLVSLLAGMVDIDAVDEARALAAEIDAPVDDTDAALLSVRFLTGNLPLQMVRLGDVDRALRMVEDRGTEGVAGVSVANELVIEGEYARALPLLREIGGDIGAMMMAGMADRISRGVVGREGP